MLKRILTLSLLSTAVALAACAPFKATGEYSDVRGKVSSLYFNGPLANASVSIPQYSINVKTDENGYFEIRGLPTKWLELEITHPSHQALKRAVHIEPYGSKYIEVYTDKTNQPDSHKVVFERNYDIWTSDIYGQNQTSLTGKQDRKLYRSFPVWSKDKSQISFIGTEVSQEVTLDDDGVWMMRSDGAMPRRITTLKDSGTMHHLDWSADGNQFLFMFQDRIFVYNYRLGTMINLGTNLTRPGALQTFDAGPVWTQDGTRVVSSAMAMDLSRRMRFDPNPRQIFIGGQLGGTKTQLTSTGDNYGPAVSHDDRKIAYVSTVSGSPELWKMDMDGSNPQQLSYMQSATQVGQPRWSSDDRYILFTTDYQQRYKSNRPKELWAYDTSTGKIHMVTNDAERADG